MRKAKLNDIDGIGELSFVFTGEASSSVGWFQPDRAADLAQFEAGTPAWFEGWLEKEQANGRRQVRIIFIDEETSTVRLLPGVRH